jgi:putative aminopeptidase FrvX
MSSLDLLQDLVRIAAPPGQEEAMRTFLRSRVEGMVDDARGNLSVGSSGRVAVMAHMDEIALMVRGMNSDGLLAVAPLGGIHPYKLGEGPVQVLAPLGPIDGVLSFGSIHTEDSSSVAVAARSGPVNWEMAVVVTGLDPDQLDDLGVRAGTRVVVHQSRRELLRLGDLVAGHFLDDRADLAAWLLAQPSCPDAAFVATASEETGGEGALFWLGRNPTDVVIALELGPNVPDAPVVIDENPTVWVCDGYSAMQARDIDLVAQIGDQLGLELQFQALSRGGSDASCAASHGLCARPITLGIPMENSHGFEIIHPGAMENLARLTVALVRELC